MHVRVQYFPNDRSNCKSNNKGCVVGNELMANDFPIRTEEGVTFSTDATVDHDLPQESDWQPSRELKDAYDYSGGLVRAEPPRSRPAHL